MLFFLSQNIECIEAWRFLHSNFSAFPLSAKTMHSDYWNIFLKDLFYYFIVQVYNFKYHNLFLFKCINLSYTEYGILKCNNPLLLVCQINISHWRISLLQTTHIFLKKRNVLSQSQAIPLTINKPNKTKILFWCHANRVQ